MKTCSKCKAEKPLTQFSNDRTKRDGLCSSCKQCNAIDYTKRERTPERTTKARQRARTHALKKFYGLTSADYDRMLAAQEGVCAICHTEDRRRLAVDHNHQTGEVRKLLCYRCNIVIGLAEENAELLEQMKGYLKHYG